ncbi:hypothetical protein [Sneathiella sp.]|jgi:hypothetical protein|uniref:hypothetical protein n=1 Tax=Sneathiella sp. TaxID=1964365 RepID=UPI0039E3CBCA
MSRNYTKIGVLNVLLALFALFGAPKAFAIDGMIELSVNGDAGQVFSGDCYLKKKRGAEARHRIQGQVPVSIWLPADAVRCNLQKSSVKGQLIVSLKRGEYIEITQKSRYPLKWVVISSRGPWGQPTGGVYAARPVLK